MIDYEFIMSLPKRQLIRIVVGNVPRFHSLVDGHRFSEEMGLWSFLEGFLLLANAMAILNEERFLAPRGWTLAEATGPSRSSLKGKIIGFIHASSYHILKG
ncbi:hypothetical protein K1719_037944 [Acacia pycnantha]|nr:hypothetical protein K1719_037944 [Acacia pycnantha]